MGHSGGVSETGLRRLREGLARYVDLGKIPGLVALVGRGDLLLTVAASHGNVMAGLTEILIRAGEQRRGLQYDTAVVPSTAGTGSAGG